jgi:glycosyltransferase involved in cell wall biosynthesis
VERPGYGLPAASDVEEDGYRVQWRFLGQAEVSMIERVVLASPGGWNAPSARYRLGALARTGNWPVEALSAGSFPKPDRIQALMEAGGPTSVLVLQRVLPSREDLHRLRKRYGWLVLDIDDAIYAVPPDLRRSHLAKLPKQAARLILRGSRSASARKRPLERTLRAVDVCVVGNRVLAGFARRHAQRVVEIPTTVEPINSPPSSRPDPPVVVWMGLPDNLQYLELVRRPLQRLAREIDFRLRIVSSRTWESSPLPTEFVPWSAEAARDALLSSSVGVAPLTDDPWTRGKCAFRSIQYGGHALPAVASPIGITDHVVLQGKTGFLARTGHDWLEALRTLLKDPRLVDAMGEAGLDHIRTSYSDQVAVRRWFDVFISL